MIFSSRLGWYIHYSYYFTLFSGPNMVNSDKKKQSSILTLNSPRETVKEKEREREEEKEREMRQKEMWIARIKKKTKTMKR